MNNSRQFAPRNLYRCSEDQPTIHGQLQHGLGAHIADLAYSCQWSAEQKQFHIDVLERQVECHKLLNNVTQLMILVLFAGDRCPHCPSCEALHFTASVVSAGVFGCVQLIQSRSRCRSEKNKWQMLQGTPRPLVFAPESLDSLHSSSRRTPLLDVHN